MEILASDERVYRFTSSAKMYLIDREGLVG